MSTLAINPRARLSRDELHQLRWLLGLGLVLLAFWTLYNLDVGGFAWRTLFLVTAALALVFPGWPGRIPAWVRRWSLILGASALFTQFIATRFDIISGLVLLVSLLTLSRGLQYRRLREDWQLILLCLFIIILSGVLTLSLWFALQILLFTLVAMALLFVMNLAERDPQRALTTADWRTFHWGRFLRRVREVLDLRQLFQAGGLFVVLVLVGSLIFISFPRFQFAQSFSFPSQRGVSGFHDEIQYAETRGVDVDTSVAFRVDMHGFDPPSTPYWRMIVLDDYRSNGFRLSPTRVPLDFGRSFTVRYSEPNPWEAHLKGELHIPPALDFYIEGNLSEYLPILGPFDALTFSSGQNFRADEPLKIYRTEQASPKLFGYQVEGMDFSDTIPERPGTFANITLARADEYKLKNAPMQYPMTCLGLPAPGTDDRKVIDGLVAKIKAGQPNLSESQFIAAAAGFLLQNHIGSMEVDLSHVRLSQVPGAQPTDMLVRWLDSTSPGWCEHFAGGFVLLCRAAGYPARVVAGYRGASYNSIDKSYSVSQDHAHSWAEVYDVQRKDRWLRVDPSPGAPTLQPGDSAAAISRDIETESGWGAFTDSLRMIWYRHVINFDQTDQQELVAKVSDFSKGFGTSLKERLGQWGEAVKGWFSNPLTPGKAALCSVLVVLCGLVFLLRARLRNLWLRLSARWWRSGRTLAPVRLDAGRWLRRFEPAWQTVAPTLPEPVRAEWAAVRAGLLALRYGPPDFPPDPAGTFRHAQKLLRAVKP